MGDGAGLGGDNGPPDGVGVAVDVGVGGVGALDLGDGGVGADQGVEPALGVADVGDAVGAVDGQGVDGGGAEGAHLPLVGGQSLVHGGAVGEVDGLNLEAVGHVQAVFDHVLHRQAVEEGHDGHLQDGELGVGAGATVGAGGGLLGVAAAAGGQGQAHGQGQQEGEQFLFHDGTSLYTVWPGERVHPSWRTSSRV